MNNNILDSINANFQDASLKSRLTVKGLTTTIFTLAHALAHDGQIEHPDERVLDFLEELKNAGNPGIQDVIDEYRNQSQTVDKVVMALVLLTHAISKINEN